MVYLHNGTYSAIKKNEVLIYATTWKNLKISKEERHKRPHIVLFHLCAISKIGKSRDRKQMNGFQDQERGEDEEWLLNGNKVSFGGNENVLDPDRGDGWAIWIY